MLRVGQNRIYTPYMTVYLVISLPKIPYVNRVYMVLANPTYAGLLEGTLLIIVTFQSQAHPLKPLLRCIRVPATCAGTTSFPSSFSGVALHHHHHIPITSPPSETAAQVHALSNYPCWYHIIEEKLQLSRFLSWTFISCAGPMEVCGGVYVRV